MNARVTTLRGQKMKKTNPRKVKGYTLEDVNKAEKKGQENGLKLSMVIFLTVLVDKFNGEEYIQDVWRECEDLSDSISKGYVDFWDLKSTLEEEYNISVG